MNHEELKPIKTPTSFILGFLLGLNSYFSNTITLYKGHSKIPYILKMS
ncbi:hypothetical protein RINTHH_16660 [Richelia intracellularis HH01]|uniref:Uncharacterized protein n=1 Tax=Richelia intracellularis HH01 TaxID=1165094 RepID=M1X630_9NOST|nr:hypothetical protein RINTHH_16660 [Richelia intracellularis HH01]